MSVTSNSKIRVAVLRGGPGDKYDSSMKTGEHVLSILRSKPDMYEPVDIFISKEGVWHLMGVKKEPHEALKYSDVVFNALHGQFAEQGEIQRLLSALHVPYTSSSALSSVMSLNKDIAKKAYLDAGLLTPRFEIVTPDDEVEKLVEIFRNYLHPVVIKPSNENYRKGISLVYTFDDLVRAVDKALENSPRVIVEEFIRGREARCGVIEDFRGDKLYALIPVEVVTPKKNQKLPDYELKFKTEPEYLHGAFTQKENKILEHTAKKAHEALNLRHYSYSDLIMTPQGKIYVLESNILPDFSNDSLLKKSLNEVGSSPDAFVDHIIRLALETK